MIEKQLEIVARDREGGHRPAALDRIVARQEQGMIILSPLGRSPGRRVLYINSYGGKRMWEEVQRREAPTHHLWGCVELAAMGYEIAIPEPLGHFSWRQRQVVQDFPLVSVVRDWLGKDGIVFAGHTVLYWIPLLRKLRALKATVISQIFARDTLDYASSHDGIIALTPSAEKEARIIAPKAKVVHLGWGVDLDFFPQPKQTDGDRFFACGIANRDFPTLAAATRLSNRPFDVICPGLKPGLQWGDQVNVYDGGEGWNIDLRKKFTFREILDQFYPRAAASLVIHNPDPHHRGACGFTNILEGMAMGKPVICTRTGAVADEVDLEGKACGIFVDPADRESLADAVERIARNPQEGRAMGRRGRELCEQHYSMVRYSHDLDLFFRSF